MNLQERLTGPLRGVEEYIILEPDPRLHEPWPSADFETTERTLKRMIEMTEFGARDGRGLGGLSSVQVLLPGRAVTGRNWPGRTAIGFINPVIVDKSEQLVRGREGCFSLEFGKFYTVLRPRWIAVEHETEEGIFGTTVLYGDTARFVHHEIDHINGILISEICEREAA